jgi:hypothetical protein
MKSFPFDLSRRISSSIPVGHIARVRYQAYIHRVSSCVTIRELRVDKRNSVRFLLALIWSSLLSSPFSPLAHLTYESSGTSGTAADGHSDDGTPRMMGIATPYKYRYGNTLSA